VELARGWITGIADELESLKEEVRLGEGKRLAKAIGMCQALAESHHSDPMPAPAAQLLTEWNEREPWAGFNKAREEGKESWLAVYPPDGISKYKTRRFQLPVNWYLKAGPLRPDVDGRSRAKSKGSNQTNPTAPTTHRTTEANASNGSAARRPRSVSVTGDVNSIVPGRSLRGTSWATSLLSDRMAWQSLADFYELPKTRASGNSVKGSSQGTEASRASGGPREEQ
jgi:hypothetical protein